MNVVWLHIIASVLVLAGLALIVIGLNGPALLWQIGLGTIAVAMLFSFATHWTAQPDDEDSVSREEL